MYETCTKVQVYRANQRHVTHDMFTSRLSTYLVAVVTAPFFGRSPLRVRDACLPVSRFTYREFTYPEVYVSPSREGQPAVNQSPSCRARVNNNIS